MSSRIRRKDVYVWDAKGKGPSRLWPLLDGPGRRVRGTRRESISEISPGARGLHGTPHPGPVHGTRPALFCTLGLGGRIVWGALYQVYSGGG